jgi:predicted DNA-binding protein (UPF0278 family)
MSKFDKYLEAAKGPKTKEVYDIKMDKLTVSQIVESMIKKFKGKEVEDSVIEEAIKKNKQYKKDAITQTTISKMIKQIKSKI